MSITRSSKYVYVDQEKYTYTLLQYESFDPGTRFFNSFFLSNVKRMSVLCEWYLITQYPHVKQK